MDYFGRRVLNLAHFAGGIICYCYLFRLRVLFLDHRHTDQSMADSGVPQEQLLELLVQMKVIVAVILVRLFTLMTHSQVFVIDFVGCLK